MTDFLFRCTHTALAQGLTKAQVHIQPTSRTRMCHLVASAVPDLFDTSIHFISFLIISLITLLFLMPYTFNFHDVVDKCPAYFRSGPWHPGRERASHTIKASHGPRVRSEERAKKNNGKPKWKSNRTDGAIQVSKGSGNVETSKTGISDLENLRAETSSENQESVQMGQVCVTETSLIHKERLTE